ncbi:MAG: alpha/beta hydrolase, partial [Planctomycetota bacterium]|nr:alpha/beta hydrolase [Planctomycetota bacterium]
SWAHWYPRAGLRFLRWKDGMPLTNTLHFMNFEGGGHFHPHPILFIHGVGQDAGIWPPALRRLSGFRVLAVDLPGHGRSTGTGLHTVEAYAQKVIEFMASLKIFRAILVGTSLGGAIALYIGLEYPDLVQALGLISCYPFVTLPPVWLESLENPLTRKSALQNLEQYLLPVSTPRAIADAATQTFARQRLEVRCADWKALSRFDVRDRLENLQVPALWICGANDPLFSPSSLRLLRHLASNRLSVMIRPDIGHWAILEKPIEISAHLRTFLAQTSARDLPALKTPLPEDVIAPDHNNTNI